MPKYYINAGNKKSKINKEIYGHFSEHLGRCIYEGLYVGEDSEIPNVNGMRTDVVEALKEIKVPVLRWPGGCFADEYHWKDGIGPKENRKKMINTHWGGVIEDNSFGTHEFFELCRQIGCETYVNGNLGSGTVQEMSEWVEYMTFEGVSPMADLRAKNGHPEPWKVDFFGVGNENWGCGGNMTPEFYANEYRRYQTYVRSYNSSFDTPRSIDNPDIIRRIACGANIDDTEWTEGVLKTLFRHCEDRFHGNADGLSLHYYTHPGGWEHKGSSTEFDEKTWYMTLAKAYYMDKLIKMHGAIMDQYDPDKKLGMIVDEWGTWFDVEPGTNPGFLYQQNTMRDALVACINLNIFNKHSDRVKMTCIAQMVNVLQSVILTEGAKMVKTPTWHVFNLFKDHQDACLVESHIDTEMIGEEEEFMVPNLSESASVDADGKLHITIGNLSVTEDYPVDASIAGFAGKKVSAQILRGEMHAKNTFEEPDAVHSESYDVELSEGGLKFVVPAGSVISITVEE
ncbi:MAG: alpha-N-arabinofuranosidase [Blautia sp.]|nr:alpha-N-arabinofuranosidase [Blautia sp.]